MALPLGPEYGVKYTLTGPDGTKAVFNDSTDPNYVGVLNPDESSGLDSPDVREDATDAVEADGGTHGAFYYGRRPVVLSGFIIASSVTQRNERAAKLQAATNAMREDCTLKWTPTGGQEVELKLRRQQPLRITGPYLKKFQAPLVCASAQITGVSNKSATISGIIKSQTKFPVSSTAVNWGYEFGKEDEAVVENFGSLTSDNGSYVKITPPSDPLEAVSSTGSNYQFTIPGTAKIKGIKVEVERKASAAGNVIKDWRMRLVSNEVSESIKKGDNKAETSVHWTNTDIVASYGGYDDLWGWGTAITPTLVNTTGANGFGTVFTPQRGTSWVAGVKGEIDYHKMTVFYEEASPTNTVAVNNEGNDNSYPVVTITGACKNPVIENVTLGLKVEVNVTVGAGETLVIDFKNKTVKQNGVNVYKSFNFANSEWWWIKPGSNTIKYTVESGETATQAKIEYRNAWL